MTSWCSEPRLGKYLEVLYQRSCSCLQTPYGHIFYFMCNFELITYIAECVIGHFIYLDT
jgi:hypothetical protein